MKEPWIRRLQRAVETLQRTPTVVAATLGIAFPAILSLTIGSTLSARLFVGSAVLQTQALLILLWGLEGRRRLFDRPSVAEEVLLALKQIADSLRTRSPVSKSNTVHSEHSSEMALGESVVAIVSPHTIEARLASLEASRDLSREEIVKLRKRSDALAHRIEAARSELARSITQVEARVTDAHTGHLTLEWLATIFLLLGLLLSVAAQAAQ